MFVQDVFLKFVNNLEDSEFFWNNNWGIVCKLKLYGYTFVIDWFSAVAEIPQ